MTLSLLLAAIIIFISIFLSKLSSKTGLPVLLSFIILGMLFGSDGPGNIYFENYLFAEQVCSTALIVIIFYGGFGTNWRHAKPVVGKAILLSTVGVLLTMALTGLFCYYILQIKFWESMLIGAVVSSTDAAAVFSILRSQKLGLRYNTASLLELESGSNDPFAYMLTIVITAIMIGSATAKGVILITLAQVVFGVLFGAFISYLALLGLRKLSFSNDGFDMAFISAVALLSYALPSYFGGNGYLSCYIVGIVLGNSNIRHKKSFVHFFNGITGLMQILIFFLLGLLSFPSQLPAIIIPSLAIALFLTFVARPIAVFTLMSPLKSSFKQQLLVSFAGLRGAASIVFAIVAVVSQSNVNNDIFHIVFFIVLFSMSIQGTLLPYVARKLDMIDDNEDVLKTFNDYIDEVEVQFIKLEITDNHPWTDQAIRDISLPPNTLIVMLLRAKIPLIPNGNTVLFKNDIVVISAPTFKDEYSIKLTEHHISVDSEDVGKRIVDFSPKDNELVIMIKRGNHTIIPKGDTLIQANDILVINSIA